MTLLKENFDEVDFKKIQKIKEQSGMNWREFIIEAAKAYDKQAKEATA